MWKTGETPEVLFLLRRLPIRNSSSRFASTSTCYVDYARETYQLPMVVALLYVGR